MSGGQGFTLRRVRFQGARTGGVDLRTQATSYGGQIIEPIAGGNGALQSISGGAAAFIEQLGVQATLGSAGTRALIQALQVSLVTLPSVFLGAATTVAVPDFTPSGGTGAPTANKFSVLTTGTEWTGGIETGPDGAVVALMNTSGGGQILNIPSSTVGGAVWLSHPYVALGFRETIFFISQNSNWIELFKSSQDYFQLGLVPGSRVVTVTSGSTTMLYRSVAISGSGLKGMSAVCDVTATKISDGSVLGKWLGVAYGYDHTNTQDIGVGGAPAITWQSTPGSVSLSTDFDGTFYRLLGTNSSGADARFCVSSWRGSMGQL